MNDSRNFRSDLFRGLADRVRQSASADILALFDREPDRLSRFTVEAAGVLLDLSRQRISGADLDALLVIARRLGIEAHRDAQLRGEHVNPTEQRPALHTALRRDPSRPLVVDGVDLMADVAAGLDRMRRFDRALRDGTWRGHAGDRIGDVVAIGIGGSHLGPQMACEALRAQALDDFRIHFLSNIDPGAWEALHPRLHAPSTLFIVASKSWRTIETARNAEAARRWLLAQGVPTRALGRHFVGVTANPDGARAFGLDDDGLFPFRDWVGGRFSLWSAIGLPLMLSIGADGFEALLLGARAMDEHFATEPLERNAPVLLALATLWNRVATPSATEAVIPYCDALRLLPAYLQQLLMESNGKSVALDGTPIDWSSAPVTWGAAGTDAQHSFFQSLHQGTESHPVEFVLTVPARADPEGRDVALLANAVAQAEALLRGRSLDESRAAFLAQGLSPEMAERLAPHRVHPGNRPSTTILLGTLTPAALGALIALYEHKTAVLGWLWGINSFDQWGVELGKQLATRAEEMLDGRRPIDAGVDPSTAAMIRRLSKALRAR
ncbi:MAG: hypothetical protein RIS35_2212 [Pseudomonadota bacterium]|jgi:glucose-6-phosphate isomerase